MVAEIRKIGNRTALYTNDNRLYKLVNKWPVAKHKVRYIQNGKVIGVDFYFNKKWTRPIKRISKGQLPLDI